MSRRCSGLAPLGIADTAELPRIHVAELWQNEGKESSLWVPADHGQKVSGDHQSVLNVAEDWVVNAEKTMNSDRRRFMALSGATLTLPAWSFVENIESEISAEFTKNTSSNEIKIT